MTPYSLLYFDQRWLLISVWRRAVERLSRLIQGVLTGIIETARHFSKVVEFIINAKNLRQMPTVTFVTGTATVTATVTVDPGTDCLVVSVGSDNAAGSGFPTSITFDGTGLTKHGGDEVNNGQYRGATLWFLRNPSTGAKSLVITAPASSEIRGVCTCWQGTKTIPMRTAVAGAINAAASVSVSATSAEGDIVVDSLVMSAQTWTPGAGQTQIYSGGTTTKIGVSSKPGASSSTTMGWSGTSSSGRYVAAALIGS